MSFFYTTLIILILGPLIANQKVWAVEASSFGIHHQYSAPRPLGMGDAFVAVASDYSALYYNPAGLARREDGEINMSMDFGLTKSIGTFAKDVQNASNNSGTETEKRDAIVKVIEKVYGESYGVRAGLFEGVWVRLGWGLGIIPMDTTMTMSVHKEVGPTLNMLFYGDTSIVYGYGTDVDWVNNGRLSLGFTGKFVNRVYTNLPLNAIELAADSKLVKSTDLREGYTVDADLGLLYTPIFDEEESWFSFLNGFKPTFGMVVRNIAEAGFKNSLKLVNKTKTDEPEKLYRVIDFGTKLELPQFLIFAGRFALDVRDVMHPSFNARKGLHAGFEFDWTMASWWRGQYRVGMNQGYFTAGISALFAVFSLDLVTYGEDIGTYSTPQENRVYMLKMNLNF